MRVYYLQHVPFEGLGYIETWLHDNNHSVSTTRFYESRFELPNIDDVDVLIIMGGPMGVHDADRFPWLQDEKRFINDCITAQKKLLGICLGAQLLADCLGAKVYKARYKEIGWFPVWPADETTESDSFDRLFKTSPYVLHWHGDMFDIPRGAKELLTSEANHNQAFRYGDNIIGLQFHLEATPQTLEQMLLNAAGDLDGSEYVQNESEIQSGRLFINDCNKLMAQILNELVGTSQLKQF